MDNVGCPKAYWQFVLFLTVADNCETRPKSSLVK